MRLEIDHDLPHVARQPVDQDSLCDPNGGLLRNNPEIERDTAAKHSRISQGE